MPKAPVTTHEKPTAPVERRSLGLDERIWLTSQYNAFEDNYSRINRGINIKASVHKLLHLHGTRRIRSVETSELLANAQYELIESNAQNQSYRSEASEVRIKLFMAHADLAELNDSFWKWVTTAYAAELLSAGYKSSEAKWNFVSTLIDYSVQRLSRLATAIKVADSIIEDLDACGFALMRIQKTFESVNQERFHK